MAISRGEVLDHKTYEVKRITFVMDFNGYMGHYFASDKSNRGIKNFWKVKICTIYTHRMSVCNGTKVVLFPLKSYYSTRNGFVVTSNVKCPLKILDAIP